MANKSYNDFTSWKGFQQYFPEKSQIKQGEEPVEEYWEWDDYKVHLDRYIPANIKKNEKIF